MTQTRLWSVDNIVALIEARQALKDGSLLSAQFLAHDEIPHTR